MSTLKGRFIYYSKSLKLHTPKVRQGSSLAADQQGFSRVIIYMVGSLTPHILTHKLQQKRNTKKQKALVFWVIPHPHLHPVCVHLSGDEVGALRQPVNLGGVFTLNPDRDYWIA